MVTLAKKAKPLMECIDVELHNAGQLAQNIRVVSFARLRGSTLDDVKAEFDANLRALVARNVSRPNLIRIFGMDVPPSRYESTFDFARFYDRSHQHSLANTTAACGDVLGALQYDVTLQSDQQAKFLSSRRRTTRANRLRLRATVRIETDLLGYRRRSINLRSAWNFLKSSRLMH